MNERELITSLKSIIDSCRTFYVGTASQADEDGNIKLNGIQAPVVGVAEGADLIVKDAASGSWLAFVRGVDSKIERTNTIRLYQADPSPKEVIELSFFVTTEGLQNSLTARGLRQITGAFVTQLITIPDGDTLEMLETIPATFVFEEGYLDYPRTTPIHSVLGDASIAPVDEALVITNAPNSSIGSARIAIKRIKKDELNNQVYIQLYINPSISPSETRREIERWAIGLTKVESIFGGDFNTQSLKSSICIGFKSEVARNYGQFHAWYKQTYNFSEAWSDFTDPDPEMSTCSVTGVEIITEFPCENTDFKIVTRRGGFSANYILPPAEIVIPDGNFLIDFHYGDGDFHEATNLLSTTISKQVGDIFRSQIAYRVKQNTVPIARKAMPYVTIEGVRHYAWHVNYEGTGSCRIGFFKSIPDGGSRLSYYVGATDVIPRKHDPTSVEMFLLEKYLVFPANEVEQIFPEDDFLWSTEFRDTEGFSSNGYIDVAFPETGSYGECTFFRSAAAEGTYDFAATISFEIEPSTDWVYSETLEFIDDSNAIISAFESSLPKMTPDTKIRVRIKDSLTGFGGYLGGSLGIANESTFYQGGQETICIGFRDRVDSYIIPPLTYAPFIRHYFPDKKRVAITRELTSMIWKRGSVYIEIGGQRYYLTITTAGPGNFFSAFSTSVTTTGITGGSIIDPATGFPRSSKNWVPPIGSSNESLVLDPFGDRYLTFPVGEDKRFPTDILLRPNNSSGSRTPGFASFAYIDYRFPASTSTTLISPIPNPSFLGDPPDRPDWVPVTLQIEYKPESAWGYAERLTIGDKPPIAGKLVATETETHFSILGCYGAVATRYSPFEEMSSEIQDRPAIVEISHPCLGTLGESNKTLDGRDALFGFVHLGPSETRTVDLTNTLLSFSGDPIVIHGNGQLDFKGMTFLPLLAELDTGVFDDNKVESGYIQYQEGFIEDLTYGINDLPCLRIRWQRAYLYIPGAEDYYDYYDEHANFEIILVDLEDRIDIIYRYGSLTIDFFSGEIWAGITRESGIFSGSGLMGGLADLASRKIGSHRDGDARFYIQEEEVGYWGIHGYNEVSLYEDGVSGNPIRKAIPSMEDFYREQCAMIRVETTNENPRRRKISFYLSDNITDGEIDLTVPLLPLLSAETVLPDFYGQPPLINKGKLI